MTRNSSSAASRSGKREVAALEDERRPVAGRRSRCRAARAPSRRSSSSSARSSESWPSRIGRRLRTKRVARARAADLRRRRARAARAARRRRSSRRKASSSLLLVERCARLVDPAADVDADGDVQRVGVGRERLVEPAARQVHRVAGAQRDVEHRLAGRAERRAVALVLQRQLEHRLVDEPALLAGDLERDHLVRVVVDRAAPASRAACSTRSPARGGRGTPRAGGSSGRAAARVVQALEHDRRAAPRTPRAPPHVGDAGEGRRPPGEVGRVAGDRRARLDEPECRRPDPGLGDQPLDVPHGEEVVEAAFLRRAGRRAASAPSARRGSARARPARARGESEGARRRPSRRSRVGVVGVSRVAVVRVTVGRVRVVAVGVVAALGAKSLVPDGQ